MNRKCILQAGGYQGTRIMAKLKIRTARSRCSRLVAI